MDLVPHGEARDGQWRNMTLCGCAVMTKCGPPQAAPSMQLGYYWLRLWVATTRLGDIPSDTLAEGLSVLLSARMVSE
jgi:hypothetical protein